MARTRRSSREILQERLKEAEEAIAKYEECLQHMKEEKKACEKELHALELEELMNMMNEQNISVEGLRQMIKEMNQ